MEGSGSARESPRHESPMHSVTDRANLIRQFANLAISPQSSEPSSSDRRGSLMTHYRLARSNTSNHISINMEDSSPTRETTEFEPVDDEEDGEVEQAVEEPVVNDVQSLRDQYTRLREQLQQNRDAQTIYEMVLNFIPFVLLFLLKGLVVNGVSIAAILIGFFIFVKLEGGLLKCLSGSIASAPLLFLVFLTLLSSSWALTIVYDLHIVFDGLMLRWYNMHYISFFDTLFAVMINDICSKYIIVSVKILVASVSDKFVTLKIRRKVLQTMEYTSQIYRAILPIPLWSLYFLGPTESSYFDMIVLFLYLGLKSRELFVYYPPWISSVRSLFRMSSYGSVPTKEEIDKEPKCSICYDEMVRPVKLSCAHMFCAECVDTWLEQKHTCPMCRATIDKADKSWKGGHTSKLIRFY